MSKDRLLPVPHDPRKSFPMETLSRPAMAELGYSIRFSRALPEQRGRL